MAITMKQARDNTDIPLIPIPETDRDLLLECDVETFRSSGKGGQHVNKTESGVRLRHRPTGVVAIAQDERSQFQNRRIALARLRKKLEANNRRKKKRIPTKKPGAVRSTEREVKQRLSAKKRLRKPPSEE